MELSHRLSFADTKITREKLLKKTESNKHSISQHVLVSSCGSFAKPSNEKFKANLENT